MKYDALNKPYTRQENSVLFENFQNKKLKFAELKKTQQKTNHYEEEDAFIKYPARALAYTNEVAVALKPIPVIGEYANILWAPALMYFGADIWDKYKKGLDGSYQHSDRRTGLRQAAFQATASVALPTASIWLAHHKSMYLGGSAIVNKTHKELQKEKSIFNKGLRIIFGEKIVNKWADNEIIKKPLETTGKEALETFEQDRAWKITKMGQRRMRKVFTTVAGFVTLAAVAIPIDRFTENIFLKRFVDPALKLKEME